MNAEAIPALWWPTFGLLALESALVIGLGALCARLVPSAVWRRTIWQGCVVTVLGLVAIEFSGSARAWISQRSLASSATLSPQVASPRVPEVAPPPGGSDRVRPDQAVRSRQPFHGEVVPAPVSWDATADFTVTSTHESVVSAAPGLRGPRLFAGAMILWAAGTVLLIAKSLFSRILLALVRLRSRPVQDAHTLERLDALRVRLKLRSRISLFESDRLSSPVACGVFRPAIGLPREFIRIPDATRQEVILLHELAHLKAGDPLWYWVADAVVALLWWQPVVWWMRRRLHAASEYAADEASLLVTDGPGVLAECLVELGQHLTKPRPTGWLGVEGGDFHSGLGRRVERLLNLGARSWQPPKIIYSALARTVVPAALMAMVLLATAWTIPVTSTEGDHMKNSLWKKSMTALALASAFGAHNIEGVAAETNALPRSAAPAQDPGAGGGGRGGGGNIQGGQGGGFFGRQIQQVLATGAGSEGKTPSKLKAKLDAIIVDEVSYDCIPLGQVIESLIKEAARRDPDKAGINFLMGKATDSFPVSVDPATGLPITAKEPLDLASVTICIQPPLKKVRLIDVLDAITRVADRPINYSIEEYAVVWKPVSERPGALLPTPPVPPVVPQVRAFKLDTNVFLKSLEKAFRIHAESDADQIREILWHHVFPRVGLHLNSETSAIIYNDVTGVLLVRATPEDLAVIQATIETLGGKPSTLETASAPAKR